MKLILFVLAVTLAVVPVMIAVLPVTYAQQPAPPPPQTCEETRDALSVQVVILQNARTNLERELSSIVSVLQKTQARVAELEKAPKPVATATETKPKK